VIPLRRPPTRNPKAAIAKQGSRSPRSTLTALFVVVAAALLGMACSKGDCDGVLVDGECQRQCLDSLCQKGQRCVDNVCSSKCDTDDDCRNGQCEQLTTDHGAKGRFCSTQSIQAQDDAQEDDNTDDPSSSDEPSGDEPSVPGKECSSNAECFDPLVQKNCVSGHCVATCQLHDHCAGIGACTGQATDTDGQPVHYCQLEEFPHAAGQYGAQCLNGNADCDDAGGFVCFSKGEGDTEGYCSKLGCEDDAACPAGYYCNHDVSTRLLPCSSECGLVGDATDPQCIPSERIGEGKDFRCTPEGLELRSCRKRDFCSSCQTNADCRGFAGQICALDPSGQKICTFSCDPTAPSCPWGSASSCAIHDRTLGTATCAHRSGSCQGNGLSCDPCVDDSACPNGFCSFNSFTGEQFCVDLRDSCECEPGATSCYGGGCPTTASGLEMICVPREANGPPAACFGSTVIAGDETSQLGCWPQQ
jgi:hypothetical protein